MNYVEGDTMNIAQGIREIDPLLSLSLDYKRGKFEIKRNNTHVMYVDPGELDNRVLVKLRKNDLARRRLMDYILELERSEDEAEKRRANEYRSKIESITLDHYDRIVGIPHFSCGSWKGVE